MFVFIEPKGLYILKLHSTDATIAQYAMTLAYHTGNTLVVGAFAYSTVVFSTLFGIVLWGEKLHGLAWTGIAMIVGGGVLSLGASRRPA